MLKIHDLHTYYGEIEALKGVSLEIPDGKICCIIGSNGAGKSSLLKSISGMTTRTGSIQWEGHELIAMSPRKIAKLGVTHVPEGRHTFPGLSTRDNLAVGTIPWNGFLGRHSFEADLEYVYNLFPRLREREHQKAWSMSGGEQQMLAIGRAIMARPKLLMLDEPSMGLAPLIIEQLFASIQQINQEEKIPILLVEQNARMALKISDYAYVLEQGKISFSGLAAEMRRDPRIAEAYLGKNPEK